MKRVFLGVSVSLWLMFLGGCHRQSATTKAPVAVAPDVANRVVVYCSVDDVYAKPVVAELERRTGLKIDVLYDTEAAKTAGLANKIRAEKFRPNADVFWSSACLQTLLLAREKLLQPYQSPSAKDIPAAFKAKDGLWTSWGFRGRVLILNPKAVDILPSAPSLLNCAQVSKGQAGISNPQFGTASDWAAALATRQGNTSALQFFRDFRKTGAPVLPGNSVVAERVRRGELMAGVCDTDDFLAESKNGAVHVVPSQNVLVPCAVSIVHGAQRRAAAQKFVDALLSRELEPSILAAMPGVFRPRDLNKPETWQSGGQDFSFLKQNPPDDTAQWPGSWDKINEPLQGILGQ